MNIVPSDLIELSIDVQNDDRTSLDARHVLGMLRDRIKEQQRKIEQLEAKYNGLIRVIYGFWENRRDNACFIAHLEDNGVVERIK